MNNELDYNEELNGDEYYYPIMELKPSPFCGEISLYNDAKVVEE